jgi:hypothetical protein
MHSAISSNNSTIAADIAARLPQVWLQAIQSRRSQIASHSEADSASLITRLVVACEPIINSILSQARHESFKVLALAA